MKEKYESPDKVWGQLFVAVQMAGIFADSKTFPDCIPKFPVNVIIEKYNFEKDSYDFDLRTFVHQNFSLPIVPNSGFESNKSAKIEQHILKLWDVLLHKADAQPPEGGSLIPLPFPYIVPGGRFGEIYYWDSYFTMLGLVVHQRFDIIENMLDNFAHLLNTLGHIPNGNRTYYNSRSQPPFFTFMVDLLTDNQGDVVWHKYAKAIEKEYDFWVKSSNENPENTRVVETVFGTMNRYWDNANTPRPESYREDIETAQESNDADIYTHLRAGAESGWDYSSRWLADGQHLHTIEAANILPVDLNCLLYFIENQLFEIFKNNDNTKASSYKSKAEARKNFIQQCCWQNDFYFDYHFKNQQPTSIYSLAAVFPLFVNIATPEQAQKVAQRLENEFLKEGGLMTTLHFTGQQWDAPNGWAPLQWVAYVGLRNYGFDDLANEIRNRWLNINQKVFKATGKMMEKYNVCNLDTQGGGGGEYPNQDGFGWTNGVYLAFLRADD